jgi:RHS repeat-associated protein
MGSSSGFEQVGSDEEFKEHVKSNMPIDKNGYLYIYVSNTTPNINVFFDNLQVTHIRSQILEETHYYPFGLTMAGISSKAAGGMENKNKFVGQEFNTDFDISWYEFAFRSHDPQIGRFMQIDPLADNYVYNSTYAYAENDVIRAIDLEGLEKYIVAHEPINKKGVISKTTIARIVRDGKALENSIKFSDGTPNPTQDVLTVQNNISVNGTKREYSQSDNLSTGEILIAKQGKREIEEVAKEGEVVSREITEKNGAIIGQGLEFGNIGDKSVISTGYSSGLTISSSSGKVDDFNGVVGKVFAQIDQLKAAVKGIDTKSMVVTIITTRATEGTGVLIKDFVQERYKNATINVVVDTESKVLKKKNAVINSTIYAVTN